MYRQIVVIILSSGLLIPPLTTNILAQSQNFQTVQIFNGQIGLHPRDSQGYTFFVPTSAKNIHLRGTISASGGAFKTITIRLYDSSQCPPPDSQGRIHFGSCNVMLNRIILQEIKMISTFPMGANSIYTYKTVLRFLIK
jgi:hypothetical protein